MKFKYNNLSQFIVGFALLIASVVQTAPAKDGWILISPAFSKEVVLLDESKREVHVWSGEYYHGGGSRLLPDGAILNVLDMPKEKTFEGAGITGGGLEILELNGDVRWRFWSAVTHQMNVADAVLLPNGNVLAIMLEWKSKEEAEKAGRDPALIDEKGFLVPSLVEYQPKGKTAGVPVWKWSLWDHLYQQRHPSLSNYHFPEMKPGCLDIAERPNKKSRQWIKPIEISYNSSQDLILLVLEGVKGVCIIDHSTSTAEAATDRGGKFNKGGRILNRFDGMMQAQGGVDAGIPINAEWISSGAAENSEFMTFDYLPGVRRVSKVRVNEHGGADILPVDFQWKATSSLVTTSPTNKPKFSGLVAAGERHWLTFDRFRGELSLLNRDDGSELWKYTNQRGKMKFTKRSADEEGACCGQVEPTKKPSKEREVVEQAPVFSVRYYSGEQFNAQTIR